jgi:hypothetical protein
MRSTSIIDLLLPPRITAARCDHELRPRLPVWQPFYSPQRSMPCAEIMVLKIIEAAHIGA